MVVLNLMELCEKFKSSRVEAINFISRLIQSLAVTAEPNKPGEHSKDLEFLGLENLHVSVVEIHEIDI